MTLFDSRHSTRRHAVEAVMSRHFMLHHHITRRNIVLNYITEYDVTLHYISIHADGDAAATDTQPLTSLTYQSKIPQDIT
jgi:hypothetical protein